MAKIQIGISACLLGHEVRYNGGHKRSAFCSQELSQHFEFIPYCPEVAAGLGIPRKPIRLVARNAAIEAEESNNPDQVVTHLLKEAGDHFIAEHSHRMSGYIFMNKSPSCGIDRVKVYHPNGHPDGTNRGVFSNQVIEHLPHLPVEEAGRLNDPLLREQFITQVMQYHDWKTEIEPHLSKSGLIAFHTKQKYLLLSHSPKHYQDLGHLIADLRQDDLSSIATKYITLFMQALRIPATRKKHTNVLMHIQGYLKDVMTVGESQELTQLIGHYHQGIVPLIVPLTLIKHYIKQRGGISEFIKLQTYLQPHPFELGLRNRL